MESPLFRDFYKWSWNEGRQLCSVVIYLSDEFYKSRCRYVDISTIYGVYLCVPGPVRVLTVVYRRVRMVEGGHTGVWGHPPVLFQIYTHGQWLWQVSLYLTMQCGISISKSGMSDQILLHVSYTNKPYEVFIQKKRKNIIIHLIHACECNEQGKYSIRYSDPLPFLLEMHA